MGYALSQFGSEQEATDARHRMMVTVACGTAKKLGYHFEPQRDGSIEVTIGEHTHVAESWAEFARWMREDLAAKLEEQQG